MSAHPLFEIVKTTTGAVSIRNKVVNEIMHNPVGPWIEANALYIDQSRLRERLLATTADEFVIFDVGLGAAANSLAALACIRELGDQAPRVRLVSFERDLELLKFALEHSACFEHFHGYETALQTLLREGRWSDDKLTWELRHGDFVEWIDREPHRAHVIFFDPYSPNVNQEMWTTTCFQKIRTKSREPSEGGTTLYTYSRATRIRVSMIAAGFFVGHGTATGLKDETTEAATDLKLLRSPLSERWFERWKKSHLRYPFDCKPEMEASVDQAVENYMKALKGSLKT